MATHSSILVWKIPWTEKPGGLYSPWGHRELDTTEMSTQHTHALQMCNHCLFSIPSCEFSSENIFEHITYMCAYSNSVYIR